MRKLFAKSGVLLASSLLILMTAFPAAHKEAIVQVASQRTSLDIALKELTDSRGNEPMIDLEKQKSKLEASLKNIHIPEGQISDSTIANFSFVHPVMGPRKSSGYGIRVHPVRGFSSQHKGIDLAAPVGASIRAMAHGKIVFADPYAGYGKLVVIDHGNGVTTHYAHCDKLTVHPGEVVIAGQKIAEVGSTGMSSGPHLHLEVRVKGKPLNPEEYFVGLAAKAEG